MWWLWSPKGGTFAMEAVTRQIAVDSLQRLVFFPQSQIFQVGGIYESKILMKALRTGNDAQAAFAAASIEEVVAKITADQLYVVIAPHVENLSGIILPILTSRRI